MREPRVLLFTETYYPVVGGGETQARSLAEGLDVRGIPVTILTRRSDDKLKSKERYGRINVHRLTPSGPQHLKKWALILTSLPTLIKLRNDYNVILVSGFRIIGIPAILVSKLLGKVCILKADSPGEMSGEFFNVGLAKIGIKQTSYFFRMFLRLRNILLKRADAFVAISSELAQEFKDNGVKSRMIHNIPNSVDINRFRPVSQEEQRHLREKLGLPENGRIVIYTGRLVSYKGLPLLLRVWQQIQAKHRDTYLLLVGSGGLDIENCEEDLRIFVAENGMEDHVIFTDSVENVEEYLQAADIFAFPTEKEAFGISVIEAMACGLPVVGTRVGGLRDIIEPGKNGLVIEPGNANQLTKKLCSLLSNSSFSSVIGTNASQTAAKHYASKSVTLDYEELFNQILNGQG